MANNKKIETEMKDQIQESIAWFGEPINEKPATPANKNLFVISANSPELDPNKSNIFHSVVQKLLYITKRARPDIETEIYFLCTRVSKSTLEDWMKLRRVLLFSSTSLTISVSPVLIAFKISSHGLILPMAFMI